MKIGIYGGSFNPIHFGHIGLAKWVLDNTDLDELWLMVSPNNPLKDKSILADEQQRLREAREAIANSHSPIANCQSPTLPLQGELKGASVTFVSPVWGVTPGQSLVMYKDGLVVGGGIIQ